MAGKDFSLAIRIGHGRHGNFWDLCFVFFLPPVLPTVNKNILIVLSSDTCLI